MRRASFAALCAGLAALALLDAPAAAFVTIGQSWPTATPRSRCSCSSGRARERSSTAARAGAAPPSGPWRNGTCFSIASQFTAVRDSAAAVADDNPLNNVFYSSMRLRRAVGRRHARGHAADVHWRPADRDRRALQQRPSTGTPTTARCGAPRPAGTLQDFQRVALHEFGHVLGLDHPDQFGQNVAAIMNSTISDTDALQYDDILGAYALYLGTISGASLAVPAPKRDASVPDRAGSQVSQRPAPPGRRDLRRS